MSMATLALSIGLGTRPSDLVPPEGRFTAAEVPGPHHLVYLPVQHVVIPKLWRMERVGVGHGLGLLPGR